MTDERDYKRGNGYTKYSYSLFVAKKSQYLFPGFAAQVMVSGDDKMTYAILYKITKQFQYQDPDMERSSPKTSIYVARFIDDSTRGSTDVSNIVLDFGVNQPENTVGKQSVSDDSITAWYVFSDNDPYALGDIFYATVHTKD